MPVCVGAGFRVSICGWGPRTAFPWTTFPEPPTISLCFEAVAPPNPRMGSLGPLVKPWWPSGPPRLTQNDPENSKRVSLRPPAFQEQTPPKNSTRRPPERQEWGEISEGKQNAKIGAPHRLGPLSLGCHCPGPHPWATLNWTPPRICQTRTKQQPNSKLDEVEDWRPRSELA